MKLVPVELQEEPKLLTSGSGALNLHHCVLTQQETNTHQQQFSKFLIPRN